MLAPFLQEGLYLDTKFTNLSLVFFPRLCATYCGAWCQRSPSLSSTVKGSDKEPACIVIGIGISIGIGICIGVGIGISNGVGA